MQNVCENANCDSEPASVGKVEFLSQSRLAANPEVRKSLQNPYEIVEFDVFEVGTAPIF